LGFNEAAFKAAFREAARRRGVDVANGATDKQASAIAAELAVARHGERQRVTAYAAVLAKAEIRRDLHYSNMRQLVEQQAQRQFARRVWWDEARGFLRDDGSLDTELVDKAQNKYWWAQDKEIWKCGGDPDRPTENLACRVVYNDATWHKDKIKLKPTMTDAIDALDEMKAEAKLKAEAAIDRLDFETIT
jgi:hypothetical protein